MKQDLELAMLKLTKNDLSLVVAKNGNVIFETKKPGISGFLEAIETLDENLVAASLADKIVGVAAAMLCVYAGVSSVFGLTISTKGVRVLEDNNIKCVFEKEVSNILNHNKNDLCPFEKLAIASGSSEEAYVKLKALVDQMMMSTKPDW
jgi:hypothetical protein